MPRAGGAGGGTPSAPAFLGHHCLLPGLLSSVVRAGESCPVPTVLTITWTRRKNPSPDLVSFYNYTSLINDLRQLTVMSREVRRLIIFQWMLSFRAYLYGLLLVCSVRSASPPDSHHQTFIFSVSDNMTTDNMMLKSTIMLTQYCELPPCPRLDGGNNLPSNTTRVSTE